MTDADMDALLSQMEDATQGVSRKSQGSDAETSRAVEYGPVPQSATGQAIWNPSVTLDPEVVRCGVALPPWPSLFTEVERHKAVYALHKGFLRKCEGKGLDIKTATFERWCFNQRPETNADPVLPSGRCHVDAGLQQELEEAGAGEEDAKEMCKALGKASVKVVLKLQRQQGPSGSKSLEDQVDVREVVGKEGMMQLTIGKLQTILLLTTGHYSKLRVLFDMHGGCTNRSRFDAEFHRALALLLLRYNSLSGGSTKGLGGGFQGAINEEVFEVLHRRFDCRLECFASPLNCRYRGFCSAFLDTDARFGSIGDFFSFRPRSGCYEANPPFTAVLMLRMVEHMEELLRLADGDTDTMDGGGGSKPLCFIIIIPACQNEVRLGKRGREKAASNGSTNGADEHGHEIDNEDADADDAEPAHPRAVQAAALASWEALHGSPYLRRHVRLRAQEHGYIEGTQQSRPTRYKTSAFDTSVFFLQTRAAAAKWPVSSAVCAELREAFRSKHLDEVTARKGGAGAGAKKRKQGDDAKATGNRANPAGSEAKFNAHGAAGGSKKKSKLAGNSSSGGTGKPAVMKIRVRVRRR